jgi:pyruvyl transferase EpsO
VPDSVDPPEGERVHREDEAVLRELRSATVEVLTEVIGVGRTVALLDAPTQRNVGDSMIWAGSVEYFRHLRLKVVHVADLTNYDSRSLRGQLPEDGVILLSGGGNLGDIWPGHQRHRERVVADFPDRKIVQLPQSILFASPENAARANAVLGAHPDFTLLVRDRDTEARARRDLGDVHARFCCDLALGWDPSPRLRTRSAGPVLVIARTDDEGGSGLGQQDVAGALGRPVTVADWTSREFDPWTWRALRLLWVAGRRWGRLRRVRPFAALLSASYTWLNRANLRKGLDLYAGRELVVVDRLHAHVLAVLLGIDHVLLDNSYGKLGAVYRDYTGRFSTAAYARDPEEALLLAGEAREGGSACSPS